ncbi:MAG: hypothetical protein ACRDX9_05360 [Acidimicrobiia bacterium]
MFVGEVISTKQYLLDDPRGALTRETLHHADDHVIVKRRGHLKEVDATAHVAVDDLVQHA